MNKDILIIGVIVAVCVGVTAVTFMSPTPPKPTTPSLATRPADVDRRRPEPLKPPADLSPPGYNPATNTGIDPLNPLGVPPPGTGLDPLTGQPVAAGIDPLTGRPVAVRTPRDPWATPGTPAPPSVPAFPPLRPLAPTIPEAPLRPIEPAPPALDQPGTHVVAKGETGGDISMKHYGTTRNWGEIQKANPGVDPTALKIGQKLVIPVVAKRDVVAAPGEALKLDDGQKAYTVKKGDSFYSIAKSELGDATRFTEIAKLNPTVSSDGMKVGQAIRLPSRTATHQKPIAVEPTVSDGKTHVVKQGETLMDISKVHFGTTRHWREIEKANPGVDSENLHVGQKLKLPDAPKDPLPASGKKPATPVEAASAPADLGDAVEHVVKEGEYLSDIAKKHYGNPNAFDRILKANPGLDANRMRVGQKLKIPKAAPAPKGAAGEPAAPKPLPVKKAAADNPFALPPVPAAPSGFSPSGFSPSGSGTSGSDFPTDGSGFAPTAQPRAVSGSGLGSPAGADLWNTPSARPSGAGGSTAPAGVRPPADTLDDLRTQPRR